MKKIVIVALVAIVAVGFTACNKKGAAQKAAKVELKSDLDSFTYAVGVSQSQGLKDYIIGNLGVDSAYIGDFLKGLREGASQSANKKQNAHKAGIALGLQVGMMVKNISLQVYDNDSTQSIPMDLFLKGFETGATGVYGAIPPEQAQQLSMTKMEVLRSEIAKEKYKDNKVASDKWIEAKAKEPGVKKLDNGVLYKVLKEGNGPIPADTSVVKVNYEGKTMEGEVFDSSYEKKSPVSFKANQVIKGWTEVLTHMPVGSKWEVYIPEDMAYGDRSAGKLIKPFSALQFQIELLEVE